MYLLLSTIVHIANDSKRIIPPDFYVKQFIRREADTVRPGDLFFDQVSAMLGKRLDRIFFGFVVGIFPGRVV